MTDDALPAVMIDTGAGGWSARPFLHGAGKSFGAVHAMTEEHLTAYFAELSPEQQERVVGPKLADLQRELAAEREARRKAEAMLFELSDSGFAALEAAGGKP